MRAAGGGARKALFRSKTAQPAFPCGAAAVLCGTEFARRQGLSPRGTSPTWAFRSGRRPGCTRRRRLSQKSPPDRHAQNQTERWAHGRSLRAFFVVVVAGSAICCAPPSAPHTLAGGGTRTVALQRQKTAAPQEKAAVLAPKAMSVLRLPHRSRRRRKAGW